MSATVPTIEPDRATAGLTWAWRRDLADYPASGGWALKYLFRGASAGFSVTASTSGEGYAVEVAASTTAGYAAGAYAWEAYVELAAAKYSVGRGTLLVAPSLASGDSRSHARKVLDAIEAVLENRATQDQMSYEISVGGSSRRLGRTPLADLVALRMKYRAEVKAEERAAAVASGRKPRTRILTAFTPRR